MGNDTLIVELYDTIINPSEFEDIENYLWLFTKDWPLIYEVYDKKDDLSIKIIGEANVYDKIKTTKRIGGKAKVDVCMML